MRGLNLHTLNALKKQGLLQLTKIGTSDTKCDDRLPIGISPGVLVAGTISNVARGGMKTLSLTTSPTEEDR